MYGTMELGLESVGHLVAGCPLKVPTPVSVWMSWLYPSQPSATPCLCGCPGCVPPGHSPLPPLVCVDVLAVPPPALCHLRVCLDILAVPPTQPSVTSVSVWMSWLCLSQPSATPVSVWMSWLCLSQPSDTFVTYPVAMAPLFQVAFLSKHLSCTHCQLFVGPGHRVAKVTRYPSLFFQLGGKCSHKNREPNRRGTDKSLYHSNCELALFFSNLPGCGDFREADAGRRPAPSWMASVIMPGLPGLSSISQDHPSSAFL